MDSKGVARELLAVARDLTGATAGTVAVFLQVASHELTKYDKRLQKRQPNMYRLGHYLGALGEVRSDMRGFETRDDEEALKKLKKAFGRRFSSLPPIDRTVKMIDQFLKSGKYPRIASDETNPDFLFSMTHVKLVKAVATGRLDAKKLAQREMANRGLGKNGKWVGFDQAAKEWKV